MHFRAHFQLSEFDRLLAKFKREQRVEKEERENASRDDVDKNALANDSFTTRVTEHRMHNKCDSGRIADCNADDDDSVQGEHGHEIRQRIPANTTSQNHNDAIKAGNKTSTVTIISSQRLTEPIRDTENEQHEETLEPTSKRISPSRSVLVPASMMPQGQLPSLSGSDEGGLANDDDRHLTDNELFVDERAETNNSTSERAIETMLEASIFRCGEEHENSKGVERERTSFHDSVERNNVDAYAARASAGKSKSFRCFCRNETYLFGCFFFVMEHVLSLSEQLTGCHNESSESDLALKPRWLASLMIHFHKKQSFDLMQFALRTSVMRCRAKVTHRFCGIF